MHDTTRPERAYGDPVTPRGIRQSKTLADDRDATHLRPEAHGFAAADHGHGLQRTLVQRRALNSLAPGPPRRADGKARQGCTTSAQEIDRRWRPIPTVGRPLRRQIATRNQAGHPATHEVPDRRAITRSHRAARADPQDPLNGHRSIARTRTA